jgi:hypothetical protein
MQEIKTETRTTKRVKEYRKTPRNQNKERRKNTVKLRNRDRYTNKRKE